jgi:hypothetical protein
MRIAEVHVGAIFIHRDRLVEVISINRGPKIVVRDLVSGVDQTALPEELRARPAGQTSRHLSAARSIFSATDSELEQASQREQIVLEILGQPGKRDVAVQRAAEKYRIGKRSI